jgi:hypothetical protein
VLATAKEQVTESIAHLICLPLLNEGVDDARIDLKVVLSPIVYGYVVNDDLVPYRRSADNNHEKGVSPVNTSLRWSGRCTELGPGMGMGLAGRFRFADLREYCHSSSSCSPSTDPRSLSEASRPSRESDLSPLSLARCCRRIDSPCGRIKPPLRSSSRLDIAVMYFGQASVFVCLPVVIEMSSCQVLV